jgi:tryptophan synthase alpha subunit
MLKTLNESCIIFIVVAGVTGALGLGVTILCHDISALCVFLGVGMVVGFGIGAIHLCQEL